MTDSMSDEVCRMNKMLTPAELDLSARLLNSCMRNSISVFEAGEAIDKVLKLTAIANTDAALFTMLYDIRNAIKNIQKII